jgi:hypothetical protein
VTQICLISLPQDKIGVWVTDCEETVAVVNVGIKIKARDRLCKVERFFGRGFF